MAPNLVHEDHQQGGARIENRSQRLSQKRRFVFGLSGGNKGNIWPRCRTDEFSFFFVLSAVQSVEEYHIRFMCQQGFRFDVDLTRFFSTHCNCYTTLFRWSLDGLQWFVFLVKAFCLTGKRGSRGPITTLSDFVLLMVYAIL